MASILAGDSRRRSTSGAGVPPAMARSTSEALAAQVSPARSTSRSAAAARAPFLAAVDAAAIALEAALARAASSATGVGEGSAPDLAAGGPAEAAGAADVMTEVAALLIASGYRDRATSLAATVHGLSSQ